MTLANNRFRAGDLLFFYGKDWTSRAIEWGTWWGCRSPSHVGGIFIYEDRPLICESTTLCKIPCAIRGKVVSGVQAHEPAERIADYDGQVIRLPISQRDAFSAIESERLTEIIVSQWIGEPYDMRGALESGPRWFKRSDFMPYPDLGSVFCSALWAWLLMHFGLLARDNPKKYNPGDLLRAVRSNATHGVPERMAA